MTFTEVFFTVLVIWILFRIFRPSASSGSGNFRFYTHHHHYNREEKKEEPAPKQVKKSGHIDGEYVDYEEIK